MTRKTERRAMLVLLACLLGVALLDDPSMYDPQPGPNARPHFNLRTGEWVQP